MDSERINVAASDLVLAIGKLVRKIRAESGDNELSLTQRSVLAQLAHHGPATISDLARTENVKSQSMGAAVAELEELGYVERRPHPTDGRQVNIVLAPKGEAIRAEQRAAKVAWLVQAIEALPSEDQEKLFTATEILRGLTSQ